MPNKKVRLFVLWFVTALALGWALGLPPALGIIPLASAVIAWRWRWASLWHGIVQALLVVLIMLWSPTLAAFAVEVVMGLAAVLIQRARQFDPSPSLAVSALLVGFGTIFRPQDLWFLLVWLAVVLWTLLYQDSKPSPLQVRFSLLVMGAAIMGAILLTVIFRVIPWRYGLIALFYGLARLFQAAFPSAHFRHKSHLTAPNPVTSPHPVLAHSGHLVVWPVVVTLVVLGAALLAFFLWIAWRHRMFRSEAPPIPDQEGVGIVREEMSESLSVSQLLAQRLRRTPVRALVHRRLQKSEKGPLARKPSETFREWLARTQPDVPSDVYQTYDAIRYGGAEDSWEARHHLEGQWPVR